jgi:DDE superfamily endonuclease
VLFLSLAERRGFREYLRGLLLPRDRNKTLAGLAGAESSGPSTARSSDCNGSCRRHGTTTSRSTSGASKWWGDPGHGFHEPSALVIDDPGDPKDGTATAMWPPISGLGRQDRQRHYRGTSLWADERCYWPMHAVRYTPASRLPGGERHLRFKTKPLLTVELVGAAQQASIRFRAIVAEFAYGDSSGFSDALTVCQPPDCAGAQASQGRLAPAEAAHMPVEAAAELGWRGPHSSRRWRPVVRRFRDGHTETRWAADAQLGGWSPDRRLRLVAATPTRPGCRPGSLMLVWLTKKPAA